MKNKFESVEKKFLEAIAWLEKNDFAEVRKMMLEIVGEDETFPNSYGYLGWLYSSKFNNDKQAEFYFKKGLEVDPEYLQNYYLYINFLLERARTDEARELIQSIEKKQRVSWYEIYVDYGILHEIRAEFSQAIKFYQKARQGSLNNEAFNKTTESIERCKKKIRNKSFFLSLLADKNRLVAIIVFLTWIMVMIFLDFIK